jgi:hypothetical protein
MDHDERERRDGPDEERGEQPPEPDWSADSHDDPTRPLPMDETTPEGTASSEGWGGESSGGGDEASSAEGWRNPEQPARVIEEPEEASTAPAEIESWPSQEPTDDAPGAWPTEPPAAGSGTEGTWPTEAPERHDEPAWPSEEASTDEAAAETAADGGTWEQQETPPQEVEAYPTAAASDEARATDAPAPAHAVPDAEGATGESTQCPRCGTENRPGLSFCRSCGQRLVAAGVASTVERPGTPEGTMACPRCGTHNRAGVAFCQNCGANLRGTAEGYVPPAAEEERAPAAEPARRGAVLGPVVLLIGLAGLVTAYLLPFLYGSRDSLFDRAWGANGYGIAFWNGYPDVNASLADQAYFGLAGPVPLLGLLLAILAIAGFVRAAPGPIQSIGLVVALLWSVGLIVLFLIVELAANWGGDLVGVLRVLTPAGVIFFLSSLIVLIGALTRFSRG